MEIPLNLFPFPKTIYFACLFDLYFSFFTVSTVFPMDPLIRYNTEPHPVVDLPGERTLSVKEAEKEEQVQCEKFL